MKITFLSPSLNMSGGIKVMAIYAEFLVKNGHEVNVVSTPISSKPFIKLRLKNALKLKFFYPTTQPSHFDQLNIKNHVIDAYRPIVDADVPDADIVIATWWETAEWLENLSERKGKKVYFVQGHEIFDYIPKLRAIETYKTNIQKVVVSKWLKDVLEDRYQSSNIELVPNAVDNENFYFVKRSKNLIPTIGFLVGSGHVKGLDVAIKVCEQLQHLYPNLKVITFGTTVQKQFRVNVQQAFHLLPSQAQIRELYASCDVWLAPSRSEGFNLTAMEAMACGTPVVSTNTGWPVEAIKSYKNGLLTEIDDVDALINGVKWFLDLPPVDWAQCSENAHRTTEGCTWEKSAKLFEELLTKCASKA